MKNVIQRSISSHRPMLLLLLLFCQGVAAKQSWRKEPQYTEVNPGESAVLECIVYNLQGTCSWQKNGKPQGIFDGKYVWAGDQSKGDCSLRILDAGEFDDGDWECQVTASSFTADDALTSGLAPLVVRVAPNPPYLEVESSQVSAGQNYTVVTGRPSIIKCVARYGNPPPVLKWFVETQELPAESYNQTNSTEVDRTNTWQAVSVLRHTYAKEDHRRLLRCVALHEAYDTKSRDVGVSMDVQYAPTVTLKGTPTHDVEEGVDSVSLRCEVDANPPANIVWKRAGKPDVFSFQDSVQFNPVTSRNSDVYQCEARNSVGGSDPISVNLDVKYPPKILDIGPTTTITASLGNHTMLQCRARGNPKPRYTWLQRLPGTEEAIVRGTNESLILESIGYEHQGLYECLASNAINGKERQARSEPISLQVVGAPQVLRYSVDKSLQVEKGEDALIQMVFCSDPQPSRTTWKWGSLQLDAGSGRGRYLAENLAEDSREDCYAARLRVQRVDVADARNYYLNVENENGMDSYAVELQVKGEEPALEPVTMTTVIGIVIGCLVLLVFITVLFLYAFKKEKWCFSQRGDFKPTDLESDKSDLESQKGNNDNVNTNGNTKLVNNADLNSTEKQPITPPEKR